MSVMVLAESGHIALAKSVHDSVLHFAWGTIPDTVKAPESLSSATAPGGTLNVGAYSYVVTAYNEFGETTPSPVASSTISGSGDQTINLTWPASSGASGYNVYRLGSDSKYQKLGVSTLTSFTDDGSATPNSSVNPPDSNSTFPAAWTKPAPNTDPSLPDLYEEVGRRLIQLKQYVTPDPSGTIQTSNGSWSVSDTPTKYLYLKAQFDYADAPDDMLYQFGIFIGTEATSGNENQLYLTPDMIANKGTLLGIENHNLIIRESSTRESHAVILTF